MRYLAAAAIFGCFVPAALNAQSPLVFARVMGPQDFWTTGFAVGNPGAAPAAVTLTLHGLDGVQLDSTSFHVPPNGQVARLAGDLFPGAWGPIPRTLTGGWVEGTSAAGDLAALWIGGDFVQREDGSGTAATGEDLVLPLVTSDSELNIVNPTAGPLTVVIRLYGSDGSEVTLPAVRPVNPRGAFRGTLATLFPPAAPASATHARVSCQCGRPFAAGIIARDYLASPSWSVVNAVPANSSQNQLYFPHVISGEFSGADYTSVLGLANLSGGPQRVRITFTPAGGGVPRVIERQLGTNGGLRESLRTLFGLGAGYQDGWLRVEGERPVAGFVAYAEGVHAGVSVFAPPASARSDLMFAHFVDLQPWMTGIALLNPNPSAAEIDISAHASDGSPIGARRITLPAMNKTASLLREWIPQTQGRSVDGGSIRIRSNVPIFGMELFFTTDLKILSGIGSSRE